MVLVNKFNKNNLKSKQGFTLIELLLYFGIFSIVLLFTLELFSTIFDIQLESEATSAVDVDSKFLLQRLTYDLNRASDILSPSSLGSPSGVLTLKIDDQDYIYSLNNGNLDVQDVTAGTTDRLNSSDTTVSNIIFTKLDGNEKDVVYINFTLNSEVIRSTGREIKSFEISAGIR